MFLITAFTKSIRIIKLMTFVNSKTTLNERSKCYFLTGAQKASNERDLLVFGKVSCDTYEYAPTATKLRSHLYMAMRTCG